MDYKLYCLNRQLDLLCTRVDRIGPGACRDSLIRRIEILNIRHHLRLAELAASGNGRQA
jgi:hypothetical protein